MNTIQQQYAEHERNLLKELNAIRSLLRHSEGNEEALARVRALYGELADVLDDISNDIV